MNDLATKSSLTSPQRQLVELMQRLNFGRIENLHIRNGIPALIPRLAWSRHLRSARPRMVRGRRWISKISCSSARLSKCWASSRAWWPAKP